MGVAYAKEFLPIAHVDENINITPYGYVIVKCVEPLPQIDYDFGTIAAETEVEDKEIEEIYMPELQKAQYR